MYIYNGISKALTITNDDIISISFINDYDNALFPIIRLRLYIDLNKFSYINEDPNNLYIGIIGRGGIYKINQNDTNNTSYTQIRNTQTLSMDGLYGYVETKNNAYTKYDNYQMGTQRDSSLNTNNKVALTIYCYNKEYVRAFKQRVDSVYKNTDLYTVVTSMFDKCGIDNYKINPFDNSEKYDQILVPNLSLIDAISYLDTYYGLYKTGSQLFVNYASSVNLTSTDDISGIINIRVSSYKSGDSFSGTNIDGTVYQTPEASVVIKSQTDLEQATNAQIFGSMNVSTFEAVSAYLDETFKGTDMNNITVPAVIHKSKNQFIPSMYKARVDERNTRIDLSISGLGIINSNNKFMFTFDNIMRGVDVDKTYRPMYATYTLSNIGSGLFDIQSTFQLC